jgi:hypothetical protein
VGNTTNPYQFMVWKPDGKKALGRTRRTWKDNIRTDLKKNIL